MCIRDSSYTEHTNGIPRNSKMTANIIYTSQQDVMEQQVRAARQEADFRLLKKFIFHPPCCIYKFNL